MIILSSYVWMVQVLILSISVNTISSLAVMVSPGDFDCKNVKANNYQFDLSRFDFPVEIIDQEETPPTKTRTSIKIDLCQPLPEDNDSPSHEQCVKGTRICMKVINEKKGEGDRVIQVISAGGNSNQGEKNWQVQLGEHIQGAERELQLEMIGEYYGDRKQRTEIDFRCDPNAAKNAKPIMKKYDREEGKLKLAWTSPFACTTHMGGAGDNDSNRDDQGGDRDGNNNNNNKGGWGFFSWFFFFLIVGGIIYFAAGLWRNYNEHGVIELPNKDFWREAPYIAKDMGKHIYSTVSGQGSSRGAYEPV